MASVCCICLTKAGEVKCHNDKCTEMLCVYCHSEYGHKCPVCTVPRSASAACLENEDTLRMQQAWKHYGFDISVSTSKVHVHLYKPIVACAGALQFLTNEENKLELAFATIVTLVQNEVILHNFIKFQGKVLQRFVARRTTTPLFTVLLTYKERSIYGTFT